MNAGLRSLLVLVLLGASSASPAAGREAGQRRTARAIGSLLSRSIAKKSFPGAAIVVGRGKTVLLARGYGKHDYGNGPSASVSSVYDLASLTKVVATTTAAMKLHEAGRLALDAPISDYLPELVGGDKARLTVRQLLTHTAGFGGYPHDVGPPTKASLLSFIEHAPLPGIPGEERYSDLGMIVLGRILERVAGESLATYCQREIFVPLGMKNTGFRGVGTRDPDVVPTEQDANGHVRQGEVHDEKAHALGGVAGHAGLFSTAEDLGRFARMLVLRGRVDGGTFLRAETIDAFTGGGGAGRGLGWEKKSARSGASAGQRFGPRSYGHTGFTGTSLWIDPDAKVFAILLTNRVHPSRANETIKQVRPRYADLAFQIAIAR